MLSPILDLLSAKLVRVNGSSMAPALPNGSWILVNRRAYARPRRPERFDIVRFEDPAAPGRWLVKRIVGLPDEEVKLENGNLIINGMRVPEPHAGGVRIVTVSSQHEWWPCANEYVVLGDNREASTDSRKFGTVPISALRGRVTKRLR